MPNKKVVVTNTIICTVLLVLGFLVNTINLDQTYLTVSAPLSNGDRNNQQIGLMFIVDDPQLTPNLANILASLNTANASATFFFTGTTAINNLDILKEVVSKHELGNYGFSNKALNIADKNIITEEIQLSDALLTSLTQSKMKVFTPPLGLFNRNTIAMADNLGYTTVLPSNRNTNIDWDTADSNLVQSYATCNIQNGDIVALKPTAATMQCLSPILAHFTQQGLKVTSLEHLLQL